VSDTTELTLEPEPAPRERAGGGRILAGLVAVVAVLAAGLFAVNALQPEDNGPEDPVRAMFEAAEKSDVIGVLEQLLPGERDALKGPLTELVEQLNRLEVLDGADLDGIDGLELAVDDLELESKKQRDDLALVRVTSGTGSYRVDLGELPIGDFVLDIINRPLEGTEADAGPLAMEGDGDAIATVKRDGRWYVSIGYSVAEQARQAAGVELAALGDGVEPAGGDSPEEAVEAMFGALTTLDARRMVALLPPDELGAVQEYAGLFLPAAEDGAAEAEGMFSVRIENLELESDTDGDEAVVKIREVEVSGDFGGMSFSYADGCATIEPPPESGGEEERICNGDDPASAFGLFGGGFFPFPMQGLDAEMPPPPKLSFEGEQPDLGIVTTRVDGRWYVSPTRTMLDALVESLELFERSDLDAIRRYFGDLFGAFMGMGRGMATERELTS
jgi:hypothetical protein